MDRAFQKTDPKLNSELMRQCLNELRAMTGSVLEAWVETR
jgi:hypothetical protein